MNQSFWLLALLGMGAGLLVSVLIIRAMLKAPATRVWIVNWLNWGNSDLPSEAKQLVRHGQWIARIERNKL